MTELVSSRLAPLGRRRFLAALIGTGFWPLVGGARLAAAAQGAPPADVRLFGAAGNGVANDTLAFRRARRASATIYAPAGTYLVDTVLLPAGTTLITDGAVTRFKQRRGIREETRLLTVTGSNVAVGDCTVEGNIATDVGEHRHGVFVQASPETGPISNVRVGNIQGANLRGDVVYVGSMAHIPVADVQVGNVHGANILRNVVSVVGGRNIIIGHITGLGVGLKHLDVEPDQWNTPVVGCSVLSVRGGLVQVAGQTPEAFVDDVSIALLDLSWPSAGSNPPYVPGLKYRQDALLVRNFKRIEIQKLVVDGFPGSAVFQIWERGALPDQYLYIGQANLSNCCTGSSRRAYIEGNRNATDLRIDTLAATITKRGIDVVKDCKSARITRASGKRPPTSRLIALSSPVDPRAALAVAGAGTTAAVAEIARRRWR
jgi:hypothetical protein